MSQTAKNYSSWLDWEEIVLEEHENEPFRQLIKQVPADYLKRNIINPLLVEAFDSEHNSATFKKKLAFFIPQWPQPIAWAFQNLGGTDLVGFLQQQTAFREKDTRLLVRNPKFRESVNSNHDSFRLFLVRVLESEPKEKMLRNSMVEQLVDEGFMNLELATKIISENLECRDLPQRPWVNEEPIARWARKEYNMGDDVPDSWVIKLLTPIE